MLAQSVKGSVGGSVTDTTGAAIPGAQITLVNTASGTTYNGVSTSAGVYRFPDLDLGTYNLTVTSPGFKSAVRTGVLVQINTVTAQDIQLSAGNVTETVSVNADALTLETESSDQGGVASARQIEELPLALGGVGALRSPEAFVFLQPATTGPGTANSSNGIFLSKIAGGQNYGNEVLLDGASQERSENGSSFDEEAPSVEALQEFKVTTSLPEAEYGRTTGGVEDFALKRRNQRLSRGCV